MEADARQTRWRWMVRHSEMAACNHLFDVAPDEFEEIVRASGQALVGGDGDLSPRQSHLPKAVRTLCGMPPVDARVAVESPDLHYCRKCKSVAMQRDGMEQSVGANNAPAGQIRFNNNPG